MIGVVYAYYEKSEEYKSNLFFFLDRVLNGPNRSDNAIIVVVVNGAHTVEFPQGVVVIERENIGYDFAGYRTGFMYLADNGFHCDFYMCLNGSCRGPFLPPYYHGAWYQPFIDNMTSARAKALNVHLVGATINSLIPAPRRTHVQSYVMAMTRDCMLRLLMAPFFLTDYSQLHEVVNKQEVGLSLWVLQQGWNFSCMVPEYQGIDYRELRLPVNMSPVNTYGDIVFPGKVCFGRDLHPYEIIFMKTSRRLGDAEMESLSAALARCST